MVLRVFEDDDRLARFPASADGGGFVRSGISRSPLSIARESEKAALPQ
jgi:hypothetical protein